MFPDKIIETISVKDVKTRLPEQNYRILRLDAKLNLALLRSTLAEVLAQYQLISKDGYEKYEGIGLQYEDAENPLYDAVQQVAYFGPDGSKIISRNICKNFYRLNQIGEMFQFIFDSFPGMRLYRGRILRTLPGMKMAPHTDGNLSATLHIPIETNPDNIFFIENEAFHLPADGAAYLVNTSLVHHVENLSQLNRIHITFRVNRMSFMQMPEERMKNLYDFLGKLSLDDAEHFFNLCKKVRIRGDDRCWFCGKGECDLLALFLNSDTNKDFLHAPDVEQQMLCLCVNCYSSQGAFEKENMIKFPKRARVLNWLKYRNSPFPMPTLFAEEHKG